MLTLAVAIGCNVATFSIVSSLLLRPLPYPDGERLVYLYNTSPQQPYDRIAVSDFIDRQRDAKALTDSAIYYDYSYDLLDRGTPQRIAGVVATPSLFSTLGVGAQLGRTFTEDEAIARGDTGAMWVDGAPVVVLSDALWRSAFAADPHVLGRTLRLSGRPYQVIGVMPASFQFPRQDVRVWLPFAFSERQKSDTMRRFAFAESIGRLRPGASLTTLRTQLAAIAAHTHARLRANADAGSDAVRVEGGARSLHEQLTGDRAPAVWLLQGAAIVLLLAACSNVANLLLLRLSARQRDFGMRSALGATPWRLAAQLIGESLLLAGLGGGLGLLVSSIAMHTIGALGVSDAVQALAIRVDARVVLYTLLITTVSALVTGLAPVLAVRPAHLWRAIGGLGRGSTEGRRASWARNVVTVAQISLSTALLICACLLLKSYGNLQQQPTGFDRWHTISASINLSRDRYRDASQIRQFQERLLAAVRALPGVDAAGLMSGIPFSADFDSTEWTSAGADPNEVRPVAYTQSVDEGLFAALGIPLLRGRPFLITDDEQGAAVAIIDSVLAHRAFADLDPIGKQIGTPSVHGLSWRNVVGVVGSIKRNELGEASAASPTLYLPARQVPSRILRLVVRSDLGTAALSAPLRSALASIDPEQPLYDLLAMDERIGGSLSERKVTLALVASIAVIALVFSTIGLYAVLAFGVAAKTQAIGVRLALGASAGAILRLILRDTAGLLACGLVIGLALALAAGRWLESRLFGVGLLDLSTHMLVLGLLTVTALAASLRPILRATRTDPIRALHAD